LPGGHKGPSRSALYYRRRILAKRVRFGCAALGSIPNRVRRAGTL
jgi:hypothetical protein